MVPAYVTPRDKISNNYLSTTAMELLCYTGISWQGYVCNGTPVLCTSKSITEWL